ncbi:histidinol-phosphate aminotransferase family protein [Thermococcus bergensis]|uniref:pyridoxal phosphate-dependent aminotransferase n=1 Tax=Thermococcus bergensis TaxID=2689387 RepID=UPI001CEC6B41|nr:histidinol-phosphate transaminase [Thermococcus bergensis]MCA6214393.1 histidinol-phosphate aminotransferase family protein [Thermococcus bergensis]
MLPQDIEEIGKDYGKNLPKGKYLDCALAYNPFGCSSRVIEEIKNIRSQAVYLYPREEEKLKEAIKAYWGVKSEQIFLGTGSMGCLQKINKLLSPGSVVLGYAPQFLPYINDARLNGAVYEYVPLGKENDFTIDVGEIIEKITEKTSFIYIDNPHNPTGQVLKLKQIEEIAEVAERKGAILIVDEAFGEFMSKKNSAINLEFPNILVTRSFSKGFGLAGLRIGYCIVKGDEMKKAISKVDFPFSVTTISLVAALKALEDQDFLRKTVEQTRKNKEKLIKVLGKSFHIARTDKSTPIFLCGGNGNTYQYFLSKEILTVPGEEFMNLDNSYVRIRIPKSAEEFIKKINTA